MTPRISEFNHGFASPTTSFHHPDHPAFLFLSPLEHFQANPGSLHNHWRFQFGLAFSWEEYGCLIQLMCLFDDVRLEEIVAMRIKDITEPMFALIRIWVRIGRCSQEIQVDHVLQHLVPVFAVVE